MATFPFLNDHIPSWSVPEQRVYFFEFPNHYSARVIQQANKEWTVLGYDPFDHNDKPFACWFGIKVDEVSACLDKIHDKELRVLAANSDPNCSIPPNNTTAMVWQYQVDEKYEPPEMHVLGYTIIGDGLFLQIATEQSTYETTTHTNVAQVCVDLKTMLRAIAAISGKSLSSFKE